ncbi:MAG: hypothetical protein IKN55_07795 [Oscillospiraceae bacterium]|nr:hypothetical protein [Oscillospiraceae bacterium]
MFTNMAACTVWEKTVVNRAPVYVPHVMGPVYWEDTHGETVNGITRDPDDRILCIIPAGNITYMPKRDDKIEKGASENTAPAGTVLTVTSVKDFRYGSAAVQHIEVTAK